MRERLPHEAAMAATHTSSSPGFHYNLLTHTLTGRLKAQRPDINRDITRPDISSSKPVPKSILSSQERNDDAMSVSTLKADNSKPPSRTNSSHLSSRADNRQPSSRAASSSMRCHRVDSAASDHAGGRRGSQTSLYSRRTNSAGCFF